MNIAMIINELAKKCSHHGDYGSIAPENINMTVLVCMLPLYYQMYYQGML